MVQYLASTTSPRPNAGSHRRFAAKTQMSRIPIRNVGSETPSSEIVINTWAHDPAVRRHSYALLARELELAAPAQSNVAEPWPCK